MKSSKLIISVMVITTMLLLGCSEPPKLSGGAYTKVNGHSEILRGTNIYLIPDQFRDDFVDRCDGPTIVDNFRRHFEKIVKEAELASTRESMTNIEGKYSLPLDDVDESKYFLFAMNLLDSRSAQFWLVPIVITKKNSVSLDLTYDNMFDANWKSR